MLNTKSLTAHAERGVAWLRIGAIALIVSAERLPHPNPNRASFHIAAAVVFVYALAALLWAYRGRITRRTTLALTAIDVVAISVLAYLSGGAYSDARLAYFFVPIAVAFRFEWRVTLVVSVAVALAYVVQAITHPARHLPHAVDFVAVQTGYLAWIGAAATLFSALLERQTRELDQVARGRRQLLAEVMTTEENERRLLAESLHDHAIQNLLAARQDIEEAQAADHGDELQRAHLALTNTLADLRGAIFELHPHVLNQAGLEKALQAAAERASRRGGFDIDLYLDYSRRHPNEALLFNAAREFLTNAAKHARASKVTVTLCEEANALVLTTRDDGEGFDLAGLSSYVTEAHIGLLSQRERIEAAGGRLEIVSAPGAGTTITARLPRARDARANGQAPPEVDT
jgi:two-component system NarL family sensor kinase